MKKELPVFLLNGFLESGKTSLIKEIVENNDQYHNNSTLIIVCEEGEIEYDKEWCEKWKVAVEFVDDQSELTPEYMMALEKKYKPKRIVMEYNSFFNWDEQEFPEHMVIYQQITLIDASQFNVMFNNMKKIFQSMVQNSSLVIFNRCDGLEKTLGTYRRWIRGLTQQAQIAFEDSNGNLSTKLDEDLPYDLTKSDIYFEEDVYPTWYVDVFDNYQKYFNKTFKFKVFVRDITKETLICGHDVMTCCSADVQFLGYEVINESNVKPKKGDTILLECEVKHEYSKLAGEEVVMLHAKNITILPKEDPKTLSLQ